MTLTDYNNKRSVFGIEGNGINTTTKKDRIWTNKTTGAIAFTITAGSKVHVDFSPKMHPGSIFVTIGDQVKISKTSFAHNWIKGISKPPVSRHWKIGATPELVRVSLVNGLKMMDTAPMVHRLGN